MYISNVPSRVAKLIESGLEIYGKLEIIEYQTVADPSRSAQRTTVFYRFKPFHHHASAQGLLTCSHVQ